MYNLHFGALCPNSPNEVKNTTASANVVHQPVASKVSMAPRTTPIIGTATPLAMALDDAGMATGMMPLAEEYCISILVDVNAPTPIFMDGKHMKPMCSCFRSSLRRDAGLDILVFKVFERNKRYEEAPSSIGKITLIKVTDELDSVSIDVYQRNKL
uniref:Uncharacterized protein n=1 Tax=Romanomermis culicivorax TaxID=13658 RepID=A0A915KJ87_ROMCU